MRDRTTAVGPDGFTYTSPSVYVVYHGIYATDDCGRTLGSTTTNLTLSYPLKNMTTYSVCDGTCVPAPLTYPTINFATLWTNCTTKYSRIDDPPCWTSLNVNWTNSASLSSCQSQAAKAVEERQFVENHCYPLLSWPATESLQALHTAWKPCNLAGVYSSLHGVFDPPRTLGPRMAMVGPTQTKASDLLTTSAPASPAPQLVPPQPVKTFSRSASQANNDPSSNDPGSIHGPSATGGILQPAKTQRLATQAAGDSIANKPPVALQDNNLTPAYGELLPSSTTKGVGPQQGSDSRGNAADLALQGTDKPPATGLGTGNSSVAGPHAPDTPARPAPTTLFSNLYDPSFSIKAVENGPAVSFEAGSFSVAGQQPSASPASSPPADSPTNRQRRSGFQWNALLSQPIQSQELLAETILAAQVFTHAASRSTGIAADFSEMHSILHTSAASVVETSKLTDVGSTPSSETDQVGGLVSDGLGPSGALKVADLAGATTQPAPETQPSKAVIVAQVRVDGQADVPPIIVGTMMYSPVLPATPMTVSSKIEGSSNVPLDGTSPAPGEPNAIPDPISSKGSPPDGIARPNMPLSSFNAVAGDPGLTSLMLIQQPTLTASRSAIPGESSQAPGDEGPAQSQIDPPAGQTNHAPAQANSAPIVVDGTTYTPVPATPTAQAAASIQGNTGSRGASSSSTSHGSAVSGTSSYGNDISGSPPSGNASGGNIGSGSVISGNTITNSTQAFASETSTGTVGVSAKAYVGGVARVAVGISGSMCFAMMMLGWIALTF